MDDYQSEHTGAEIDAAILRAQTLPTYLLQSCVSLHADAGVNLTLTNQGAVLADLGASNRSRVQVDATLFTQVRATTHLVVASTSAANPRLYPQYSTDGGTTWLDIGTGLTTQALSLAGTLGSRSTAWINLPTGAKADVLFRLAQIGGDGAADPAVGTTLLHFRGVA